MSLVLKCTSTPHTAPWSFSSNLLADVPTWTNFPLTARRPATMLSTVTMTPQREARSRHREVPRRAHGVGLACEQPRPVGRHNHVHRGRAVGASVQDGSESSARRGWRWCEEYGNVSTVDRHHVPRGEDCGKKRTRARGGRGSWSALLSQVRFLFFLFIGTVFGHNRSACFGRT